MKTIKDLKLESIIDYLLIIWFVLSVIAWSNNKTNVADMELSNRLLVVILYYLGRFVLIKHHKFFDLVLLNALLLWYLYELAIGYLQLFGIIPTNGYYNLLVGDFQNSGPYGGFIAICDAIFTVYYYQNKNKKYSFVFIVAAILGFILLPSVRSRAALLALVTGLSLFFMCSYKKRIKKYLPYYAVLLLISVIVAFFYKKPSAQGRFFMSKISVQALMDSNFIGNGLGRFSGVYGKSQFCYFSEKMNGSLDESLISEEERMIADCPNVSFNDYLGIGIESGFVSMIVYIGIIACSLILSLKTKSVWGYGLLAYSIFALFYYSSGLVLFNILFSILLMACVSCRNLNEEKVYFYSIPMSVISLLVLSYLYPSNKEYKESMSDWSRITKRQYELGKYEKVLEGCDTLQCSLYSFPPFMFAYGRTLNQLGDYNRSDSILIKGAEYSSDPMFWNVMGNNSLALGKYREAEERYIHAFYMAPNRLYPLCLLAKLYYIEGDTSRFMTMANKIDAFVPKVESVKTEKLRSEISDLRLIMSY